MSCETNRRNTDTYTDTHTDDQTNMNITTNQPNSAHNTTNNNNKHNRFNVYDDNVCYIQRICIQHTLTIGRQVRGGKDGHIFCCCLLFVVLLSSLQLCYSYVTLTLRYTNPKTIDSIVYDKYYLVTNKIIIIIQFSLFLQPKQSMMPHDMPSRLHSFIFISILY